MSATVEIWKNELAKLGETVKAKKLRVFLSKAKEGDRNEFEEAKEAEKVSSRVARNDGTLSEDIICLLMDRFAPC